MKNYKEPEPLDPNRARCSNCIHSTFIEWGSNPKYHCHNFPEDGGTASVDVNPEGYCDDINARMIYIKTTVGDLTYWTSRYSHASS
jgi:hypothetical protein